MRRSAITSTDKPITDEPDSYYRDAVSDKIEDVELKQAIENLSIEEFNRVVTDIEGSKASEVELKVFTNLEQLAEVQPLSTEVLTSKDVLRSDEVMQAIEATAVNQLDASRLTGEAKEVADKFVATKVKSYSDYLFKLQLASKLLTMPEADDFNTDMLDYLAAFNFIDNPIQSRVTQTVLRDVLGIDYTLNPSVVEAMGELDENTSLQEVASRLRRFIPDVTNTAYNGGFKSSQDLDAIVTDEFKVGLDVESNPTFAPVVWKGDKLLILQGTKGGKAVYIVSTEENKSKVAEDQEVLTANPTVTFSSSYKTEMDTKSETVSDKSTNYDTTVDKTVESVAVDKVQYKGVEFKVFAEDGKLYAQVEGKAKQIIPKAVYQALMDKLEMLNNEMCK